MSRMVTRVRDLLTEDEFPLHSHEWAEHAEVRDDGSVLVRLFGQQTQAQAIDILAENAPNLVVETWGECYIVVRPRTDDDAYRVDFTTPGFIRP